MTQRLKKVGEELRKVLSHVMQQGHFHNPALEKYQIIVTAVVMSPDLKLAKVYVYPVGGENQAPVLALLDEERRFFQQHIAKTVRLRFTPQLRFYIDNTFDEIRQVEALFENPQVKKDTQTQEGDSK